MKVNADGTARASRFRRSLLLALVGLMGASGLTWASSAEAAYNCYWANSSCGVGSVPFGTSKNSGVYFSNGVLMNNPTWFNPGYAKWQWPANGLNSNDRPYGIFSSTERVFTRYYPAGSFSHWCYNAQYGATNTYNCGWFH